MRAGAERGVLSAEYGNRTYGIHRSKPLICNGIVCIHETNSRYSHKYVLIPIGQYTMVNID